MADPRDRPMTLPAKLGSLSGVVALGAFVVLHLWVSSAAVGSRDLYDRQLAALHGGAVLGLLHVVLVLVPLVYHAGYGIVRTLQPRDPHHAYPNDLMLLLERASGVVVLVFLVAHAWEFRAQTWGLHRATAAYSTKLVEDLSSTSHGVPFVAMGYVVGLAATMFHLVNGLSSFCTRWGYTPHRAAQLRARIAFGVAGACLFVISAAIVVQLATGVRYFPADEPRASDVACGPGAISPPPPVRGPASPPARAPSSSSPAPSALPGADR
jgi:succinate dehydrogenase / fumarate reductase cytochrome b subunit